MNDEMINECKSCGYKTEESRCPICKTGAYLIKVKKEKEDGQSRKIL